MNPILIKLVIELIKDKKEHELYELHKKFRLTPKEASDAVKYLYKLGGVNFDGKYFMLRDNINSDQLSCMYNAIQGRTLNLDEEDISKYKINSIDINSFYLPNFNILDSELIVDSSS